MKPTTFCGKPVLGQLVDLPKILTEQVVDEVIFTFSGRVDATLNEYIQLCEQRGLTVRLLIDLPEGQWMRKGVEEVEGIPVLSLEAVPRSPWALSIKRALDLVGSSIGLALFALAFLYYGSKIKRESPGPILFRQKRVGQNGRRFDILKFRTMYMDAEERLQELLNRNEMQGHMFKIKDDPRVTPLGKVLRRYHLDELPQFWNVFKGEMSLVGTRPPTPREVSAYEHHHYRRLSMKPGMTGFWQLAGNNSVRNFEKVVELDCSYITNWTLGLDIKILVRTLLKVLRGGGF